MKSSISMIVLVFLLGMVVPLFPETVDPGTLTAPSLVLIDQCNGRILYQKGGELVYPPASLTKIMTLYLALTATEQGRVSFEDTFAVKQSWSAFSRPEGASLMLLEEGQTVTWLELLKGLAIASGNDAAYAVAEITGGNVETFVGQMNETARELGFSFYYEDPDGWSENNRVTPLEMAFFSLLYINEFPEALSLLHDERELDFPLEHNLRPGISYRITETRRKRNTNLLLGEVEGVDGLKTGYIEESGFHFIATARRGYTRLIAVVMGVRESDFFKGLEIRAHEATALLEYGFCEYATRLVLLPDSVSIPVAGGEKPEIRVVMDESCMVTLSGKETESALCIVEVDGKLMAPVPENEIIGTVLFWNRFRPEKWSLVTAEETERKSFLNFDRRMK